MKKLALFVATFLCHFTSAPLPAHHGEANYDTEKTVSVKGTVTDFQFVNPHVQITIDVKNDKGEIEKWVGEAPQPGDALPLWWMGQEHDQNRRRDYVLRSPNQEWHAVHAPRKNRDGGRQGTR